MANKNQKLESCSNSPSNGRDQIKFFTVVDVAEALGVSSRTVRRAIDRKALAAYKFGRSLRIADGDLKAYVALHRCV